MRRLVGTMRRLVGTMRRLVDRRIVARTIDLLVRPEPAAQD